LKRWPLLIILLLVLFVGIFTTVAHATTLEESRTAANTSVAEASIGIFPNTVERAQELDKVVVQTLNNTFDKTLVSNIESSKGEASSVSSEVSSLKTKLSTAESKISTLETKVSKLETTVGVIEAVLKL
jgi:peptidoglycan hydrolase CwlO-like protein